MSASICSSAWRTVSYFPSLATRSLSAAVLQPAGGIAADRLQMRTGIGRIAHLDIGRRHGHRVEPADGAYMADAGAVGADEGVALAPLDAADGQFILVAELEAQFPGELLDRGPGNKARAGENRFRVGLLRRPLSQRLGECDGGIGGSGPLGLETLLIRHRSNCLVWFRSSVDLQA
jgi:hypothetical protein